MRIIDDLDPVQVRVLGTLLEKEQATPEYYPMTVNALLAGCNQKSNRDPVTALTESEVYEALDSLAETTLVWKTEGARAQKWKQSISRRLELDAGEKAVLTVLMLRGPQTVGELRTRTRRLHEFAELEDVNGALRRMAVEDRDLVTELARRPGQKESRWMQLLGGEAAESRSRAVADPAQAPLPKSQEEPMARPRAVLAQKLEVLEGRVDELDRSVSDLRRQLGLDDDEE